MANPRVKKPGNHYTRIGRPWYLANKERLEKERKEHYNKPEVKSRIKYRTTVRNCKKWGREFLLTYEQYMSMCLSPCSYCGLLDDGGVDRIDSNIGYTIENCVPCCKHCNFMKNNLSVDEFKRRIELVYKKLFK